MLTFLLAMQAVTLYGTFLLLRKGILIMATVQELKDAMEAIKTGVDTLEADIKALNDKVAAGSPVTQADLDALAESAKAIVADIADDSDRK